MSTPLKGGREGQPERCEPPDGKHRGDPRVVRIAPVTFAGFGDLQVGMVRETGMEAEAMMLQHCLGYCDIGFASL